MAGILFLKTRQLSELRRFYTEQVGCNVWLDQEDCVIFRHGNFLFGLCERGQSDVGVMLTFFYDRREQVDRMYRRLQPIATSSPVDNNRYAIYQFFARDPEGRTLEFQHFSNGAAAFRSGDDLLRTRRSIREFEPRSVPEDVLETVIDASRFAPTAKNTQPYYFKPIRDRETLDWLATLRGRSTVPIGRGPMAVAICSDPHLSKRHVHDGCIAAYHFMLAAWFIGLGTCWIAAMDRDDVKQRLRIPLDHFVVTVTPLGYPKGDLPPPPLRKPLEEFIKS